MFCNLIRNTKYIICVLCCVFLSSLVACAPQEIATPFIPPASKGTEPTAAVNIAFSTPTPKIATLAPPTSTPETTPTLEPPTPTPPCTDSLQYLEDITIPDGTIVSPGQSIEKQWRVQNDGSCNWDSRYRLKLTDGFPLGLSGELALYPARAGTQATITITFTAPPDPGVYRTAWQAYNPDGAPFGDAVYMEIVVQ
jgi:hypothetical protein